MLRKAATIVLAIVLAATAAVAAPPAREEVTTPSQTLVQSLRSDADTEVTVSDGYIYIRSNRPLTVRLFSILGQQIHQESVPAGLHRLRINAKGIYILRAGQTTVRVTI